MPHKSRQDRAGNPRLFLPGADEAHWPQRMVGMGILRVGVAVVVIMRMVMWVVMIMMMVVVVMVVVVVMMAVIMAVRGGAAHFECLFLHFW